MKEGDVVLVKDKTVCRNQWPMGTIVNAIAGSDDHVRKAEVRIVSDGGKTVLTRPITELIPLLECDT